MENLIDRDRTDIEKMAQAFRDMADRIVLNGESSFGGAFVIVPPAKGGDPIQTIILDANQDVAQFWSIVQTKAQMALAQLEQVAMQARGYAR